MRRLFPFGCLSGFLLFWSAITLLFDGFLLWSVHHQVRATGYAQVPGVITHSKVDVRRGDDTTYGIDVRYDYRVGRETFTGHRYRYGDMSSSDDYAEQVVAALPIGKQVPVYYDPYNPADSVLLTGVQGSDLFMLLFLMPFNAVMLLGWSFVASNLYRRRKDLPAAGVPMIRRGTRIHLELDALGPLGVMIATGGMLGFFAIFPIAFVSRARPSLPTMAAVLTGVIGLATAAGARQWLRRQAGRGALVLDEFKRTVSLPRTFGRTQDVDIAFEAVQEIEIDIREEKGEGITWHYGPVLVFTDAGGRLGREKIAEWSSREEADEFAAWLRERLEKPTSADRPALS